MDLDLIHIFVQVVKNGSFSKASELLRLPKSSVSKAVSRIERETGTKLLMRTTRSQTLTGAGKAFYESCVGHVEAIENAHKSLYGNDSLLQGKIKLTAPEDLGSEVIAPAAAVLSQRHPGLNFELNYTDEVLDLVKEGYDLAVRIGRLKASALKEKKLGELKLILVASPEYLDNRPKVSKVEDLTSHSCLVLANHSLPTRWQLKSKVGSTPISIQPRISSNQMSSLIRAAAAGGGIALVPPFLCKVFLENEKLLHVLPQWTSPGLPVSLLSPLPFSSSARLRTTADYLVTELQKVLG